MTDDDVRVELVAAGQEFAAAEAARTAALERVAAAVRAADAATPKVPVREMARLTGVSHVTLYKFIER